MERDFLGLNSKEPLAAVKEEVHSDGFKEIGFSKASGIHWPFSNKVSALPHLMTFKVGQEDNKTTRRVVSESPVVSAGFLSMSTSDAFDSTQKQLPDVQKSFNHERQGGHHFSLTSYPLQLDSHYSHHLPQDVKGFPVSNYVANPISMNHPFFKNHNGCQNMISKSQLLGGVPVTAPQTVLPTITSVNRVIDSSVKGPASPAQLTIFYAGQVNVYDDITPEKAQAIMFLAGNGSATSSNLAQPKIQVHAPTPKPIATDVSPVNQPVVTPPCSRLSSPLSGSSHTGAQSGCGSTSTEDIGAVKTTGVATTPVSKLETPKISSAVGSVTPASMIPSVPQARKASLARFLEKRKERVMNAAPYNNCKKSPVSSIQNA